MDTKHQKPCNSVIRSSVLGALNVQSDTPDAPLQYLKITGQILSFWSFEQMCLAYVEKSPTTSTLPIRLIIELSKLPKGNWALLKSLSDTSGDHKPVQNPRKVFAPLIESGFLELAKTNFQSNTTRYFLRLTDKACLVSDAHPDGRIMLRICLELNRYASEHPRGSNYAGLLLSALYFRKLGTPTDIAELIYDSRKISPSSTIQGIAKDLDLLSIVRYQPLGMGRGAKALILEVQQ